MFLLGPETNDPAVPFQLFDNLLTVVWNKLVLLELGSHQKKISDYALTDIPRPGSCVNSINKEQY